MIGTWILILTIQGSNFKVAAAAISSVPGFKSEAACQAAAKKWLAHDGGFGGTGWVSYTLSIYAVCVNTRDVSAEPRR